MGIHLEALTSKFFKIINKHVIISASISNIYMQSLKFYENYLK